MSRLAVAYVLTEIVCARSFSIIFGSTFHIVFVCLYTNTCPGAKVAVVTGSPRRCFDETSLVLFRVTIHVANIVALAVVVVPWNV